MANKYAQTTGNWSTTTWYTAATGGSTTTAPGVGDVALATTGITITIDQNVTCDSIASGTGALGNFVTDGNNRTLTLANGGVNYGGTDSINGFLKYTAGTLTIVGGGAGTNAINNSSSGYAVYGGTGTESITVSNSGGNAWNNTGSGYALYHKGSGAWNTTGDGVAGASASYGALVNNSSCVLTHTGNLWGSNYSPSGAGLAVAACAAASQIIGNPMTTTKGWGLFNAGGTIKWTGTQTVSAGQYVTINNNSGTLNLTSLVCANSGNIVIFNGGTVTLGSGGTLAQITNESASAFAAGIGVDLHTIIVAYSNSYTDPGAANVATGVSYYVNGVQQNGSYQTTATTQLDAAATLSAATLNTNDTDTTVTFATGITGTAKSKAVYDAGYSAGLAAGGTTTTVIVVED